MFNVSSKFLETERLPLRMLVVIPLQTHEDGISLEVPRSYEDLLTHLNYKEPPSLYITDSGLSKYRDVVEEYISPLPFIMPNVDYTSVAVYYRESRDQVSISRDWEYSRNIYLEYFPEH